MRGSCDTSRGAHLARSRGPRSYTSACENWFSPRAARVVEETVQLSLPFPELLAQPIDATTSDQLRHTTQHNPRFTSFLTTEPTSTDCAGCQGSRSGTADDLRSSLYRFDIG